MRLETLSVFPEVFSPYLNASIMGRAQKANIFEFYAHDLRDWTHDRHRTVDDAPFGGGQGMLMKPAPIFEAVREISDQAEPKPHVVFFSPLVGRILKLLPKSLLKKSAFYLFVAVMRAWTSASMSWQMTSFLWEITC